MEEAFEKLKKEGKNDVDNLIKWMKDSKVIDSSKDLEEKARDMFKDVSDKQAVELDNFKEAVAKMTTEQKKNIEDFSKTVAEKGPKLLQDAFAAGVSELKSAEAKVFDSSKELEEKTKEVLKDVADKHAGELDNFKETVAKMATEQKKNIEDLSRTVVEEGPRMLQDAFTAGVSAFKDAFTKK